MTVYADLLRYRDLFSNLFRRDFHAKYKGSLLGIAWSLLNPLVLIVLSLVFVPDARGEVWAAIPLALLFVGFVAGLALLVACLNVLFRDVEHILTAALLPWFFLTPILWSVTTLPDKARSHHKLLDVLRWGNPVAPPVFAVRDALWSGHLPRLADVIYLAVASAL